MDAYARHENFWRRVANAAGCLVNQCEIVPIVGYGDPVLGRICDEVEPCASTVKTLQQMYFTTVNARGAGLAAPQIGLTKRLVVIRAENERFQEDWDATGGDPLLMINPRLVSASEEMMLWQDEACLSMPGFRGTTLRHRHVEVVYTDFEGKPKRFTSKSRWMAACLQHEDQHLDGEMFWSKVPDDALFEQKMQWAEISMRNALWPHPYPMVWRVPEKKIGQAMWDAFYAQAPHLHRELR